LSSCLGVIPAPGRQILKWYATNCWGSRPGSRESGPWNLA
jgi:hypothetical protein